MFGNQRDNYAHFIFQDLKPYLQDTEEFCHTVYTRLVRELGHGIYNGRSAEDICTGALCEQYDLWNNAHGKSEQFVQYRFSLLELLMAEMEAEFAIPIVDSGFKLFKKSQPAADTQADPRKDAFRSAIQELNHRMCEAGIIFHYHNGKFQRGTDSITESQVYEPFWTLVQKRKWRNIDIDIKEAIDCRDQKGRDAALYALKALDRLLQNAKPHTAYSGIQ